jgi:hypothetical protein
LEEERQSGKGGECCVEVLADVVEENPHSPLLPFPFFLYVQTDGFLFSPPVAKATACRLKRPPPDDRRALAFESGRVVSGLLNEFFFLLFNSEKKMKNVVKGKKKRRNIPFGKTQEIRFLLVVCVRSFSHHTLRVMVQ